MHSTYLLRSAPVVAVTMSLAVTVSAQQNSGEAVPAASGTPTAPAASQVLSPGPIVAPAPPTTDTEADGGASPASSVVAQPPATVAPVPSPAQSPTMLSGAALDEPSAREGEKKRNKRGKKARKALARANAEHDEDDLEWGDPWGDRRDELRAAGLSFKFLLQTSYRQTFAYRSENANLDYRIPEETLVRSGDGWDFDRFFFRIAAEPNKYLGVKIITDFAEFAHNNGKQAVKQAYADLRPIPKRLHVQVGVLKLPFSITELDPITKYEFTRMGQANNLMKGLGFGGRDIGMQVLVTPFSKARDLTLALGTFRGHAKDENGSLFGALGARATTEAIKGLRFGIDGILMPKTHTSLNPFETGHKELLPNPEDPNFPRSRTWDNGQAASADVTFHYQGVMLRSEGMLGTRVDHDTRYGASKFGAVWAIAAYRFPISEKFSVQPALHAEWLDTDLDHRNGLRTQLAAGVATYYTKSVRFLLDIERTIVQDESPYIDQPLPLRAVPYGDLSNTCIAGQVQVVL